MVAALSTGFIAGPSALKECLSRKQCFKKKESAKEKKSQNPFIFILLNYEGGEEEKEE